MIYGYARCSTNETKQDIDRQVRELKAAGAEEIFLEYEHGDSKIKDQQKAMFAQAQAGDTIAANHYTKLSVQADACLNCGHCESRCPFGVKQMERMTAIDEYFAKR